MSKDQVMYSGVIKAFGHRNNLSYFTMRAGAMIAYLKGLEIHLRTDIIGKASVAGLPSGTDTKTLARRLKTLDYLAT